MQHPDGLSRLSYISEVLHAELARDKPSSAVLQACQSLRNVVAKEGIRLPHAARTHRDDDS